MEADIMQIFILKLTRREAQVLRYMMKNIIKDENKEEEKLREQIYDYLARSDD